MRASVSCWATAMPWVRQGLRAVLESYADIELVGEAANRKEAVQLAEQRRPSVVVMDISMAKMNGIKGTEMIKTRYLETVVIGISLNANGENQDAMERVGAVRLMTKEAAVEVLYDAIVNAMLQRSILRLLTGTC
ncbi:MAG TPA: response regulator transcription factor [Nitrospira sp.]|nr:response regulator transcription factor [Nitrospira sp.]